MVKRLGQQLARRRRVFFREWRERESVDLTLEAVADRMGTTKSTVLKLETGEVMYSAGSLLLYAQAVGCEPTDLITRPPPPPGQIEPIDIWRSFQAASKEAKGIVSTILKLPTP